MTKRTIQVGRSLTCLCILTLCALGTLLPTQSVAQLCGTGVGGEIAVTPNVAHIGDTITINFVDIFSSANTCTVTNGRAWLIYPDNSVQQWLNNFTLPPNSSIVCPGGATCLSFTTTYVVQAADINRNLSFQTNFPAGFNFTCGNAGQANTIQFEVAAAGNAATDPVSLASACQTRGVRIVSPSIACTKTCVNGIGENGAITFSGTVTNTGDTPLSNISVSNLVDGTLTLVTTIGSLPVNGSATFSGSYVPANPCAPVLDTIFVRGSDNFGGSASSQCSATCSNILTPCIKVTKNCDPHTVPVGGTVTFTGVVTNCGNVALTNVVLNDTFLNKVIATFPRLERGGTAGSSQPYTATYVATAADCTRGTLTNTVIATGRDVCDRTTVQDTASCTFSVTCPPCIQINKEVACFLGPNAQGGDNCDTFSKFATAVQGTHADGSVQKPAFCFRVTITNCTDNIPLTNVTVIDDKYGDLTKDFFPTPSTVFPARGVITVEFKVEIGTPDNQITIVTNTVTTSGQSSLTGERVSDHSMAAARVVPASVKCVKFYTIDGGPFTNNFTFQDQNPHVVVFYVTITNTGVANLLDLTVTDVGTDPACNASFPLRSLNAGAGVTVPLCTNAAFTCTGRGVSDTVTIVANNFTLGSDTTLLCNHDIRGSNIVASTECTATIVCTVPTACRVTGGGRQDAPLVYPDDVRYVTHGGQVGAPVGNMVCTVTSNFFIGNPCIHGRWTHVRHMQGGLEGNFHARFYDTLDCACLSTNETAVRVSVPGVNGAPAQSYTNLVYGAGTKVGNICNPGDRVAGPEPRPAPANKIAFTGVGDWADPNGRRTPRSVLFRVDIEDRSEPGGSHPKGGTPPPDRYRIRIWVLTGSETAELKGGAGDQYLINFRNAISACNGIDVQDGASVPNGTAAFGVRAPDIDDGGELERGNHQIHPSIMDCDPNNPTGPGLAKP